MYGKAVYLTTQSRVACTMMANKQKIMNEIKEAKYYGK